MNIIFIMSDTNRYDNFSCYGQTRVKTPRLDRFAEQSYVFDNAYLSSFPTVPNRLDIMSGRFSFIDHEWCALPKETVTLQQILTASGFVTQMIADNPHILEMDFNYNRGFSAFEWIRGQETDLWKTAPKNVRVPSNGKKNRSQDFILKNYGRNTAWWRTEEDHFAPRTIQAACHWLKENQDQEKFFLYLDLFDPHEPWDAPQKYLDLYEKEYHGEEVVYTL
jgi:arylsulfatase A-like enzyme